MHSREQYYAGGIDSALSNFGLTKIAIMSVAQKEQLLAAHRAKPKGLAAVPGAAGMSPAPVPNVPMATTGMGAPPVAGGPGMAPGFAQPGLELETPEHRRLARSMTGAASIPGQAAIAQRAATAVPMRYNLPNKLAALMLR